MASFAPLRPCRPPYVGGEVLFHNGFRICYRVTIEQLLKLTYHPPNTPVKTLGIDEFFAPALEGLGSFSYLLDQTLIGRYRTIYNYLTYYLHNIKVYQVGTHPLYIYIMGLTRDENLAGIATQLLETIPQSSRIYHQ
ncbi:nuclease A inhibitor family protein [Phormidium pseudopriestleyi FRX01]|uniref:Nuclease A inhibitor family protein n=1 Tax=Phormidium pseudopriestleyi FRX01 TaxID=1759528 RepID=A0ABS3FN95_9CYAN|nr:nuclease A inhibitor family protein [Phormidium pseudopriestleyi]MBO0348588.1 nuclease A inhibitor family protein [Phormidium pseudopriestleyi FRX01]